MGIAQTLLPELDAEVATTRKMIAACPEAKGHWQPHPKSMTLGGLALHLANLLTWTQRTLQTAELDLAPLASLPRPTFESFAKTLALLDANAAAARAALAAASDADLMAPWTLKSAERTFFTLPRAVCLRSFVVHHTIHHRGQLSVYLRLIDVPVPQVYGPTADYPMM